MKYEISELDPRLAAAVKVAKEPSTPAPVIPFVRQNSSRRVTNSKPSRPLITRCAAFAGCGPFASPSASSG